MKTTIWVFLLVIGAVLLIVGLSIAWRVEMRKQTFGIPPYTYEMDVPATPYVLPGMGLTMIGGSSNGALRFRALLALVHGISEGSSKRNNFTWS